MNTTLVKVVVGVTLSAFLTVALPSPAQAGLIGNAALLDAPQGSARDAQLARVQVALARADVQQQLQVRGVDANDAAERVAALSDSELSTLATRIDQQPAGGILALIGAVFVVLIILDYVGVTKVFRHR